MSFSRQAPKIHQNCCKSPVRAASDHERNSWRQQWFGRRTDVHKIRNRWTSSLWNVWNRRWSWKQSTLSGSGFYWPSELFVFRTCVQSQTEAWSYWARLPNGEDIWSAKFVLCGCRLRTLKHTGTVHAKEAVLECSLCCHTFSFLWSSRRHYISHKEIMHEQCDLNHESEVVEAEGDECEGMPEMDPSSDKSPSPMAVMSSESLGDNLPFKWIFTSLLEKKLAKKIRF